MFGGKQVLLFVLVSFLFLAVTNGSDRSFISAAGDECKNEGKCPDPTVLIGETFLFNFVTTPTTKFNWLLHFFALTGFWKDAKITKMAKKGDEWIVYSMQVEMRPVSSMSEQTLQYIGCVNDKIEEENKERRKKGKTEIGNLLLPYHHYANVVFRRTLPEEERKKPGDYEEFAMGYIERNGQWEFHGEEKKDKAAASVLGIYATGDPPITLNSLIAGLELLGNAKYDGKTNNCQQSAVAVQEALLTLQGFDGGDIRNQVQDMEAVVEAIDFVTSKCYPTVVQAVCDIGTKTASGLFSFVGKTLSNVGSFLASSEGQLVVGLAVMHILGFEQELGNLEQDIDKLIV